MSLKGHTVHDGVEHHVILALVEPSSDAPSICRVCIAWPSEPLCDCGSTITTAWISSQLPLESSTIFPSPGQLSKYLGTGVLGLSAFCKCTPPYFNFKSRGRSFTLRVVYHLVVTLASPRTLRFIAQFNVRRVSQGAE